MFVKKILSFYMKNLSIYNLNRTPDHVVIQLRRIQSTVGRRSSSSANWIM